VLGFGGALTGACWRIAPARPHFRPIPRAGRRTALPWQEASLFAEVYERIKRDYVDDVDDHA